MNPVGWYLKVKKPLLSEKTSTSNLNSEKQDHSKINLTYHNHQ